MAGVVKGAASLRRLLRRLPDQSRQELGDELQRIGNRLLGRAKAETPVRTGRLRGALGVRVGIKTLQLRLGLLTKATRRERFYGYILDQGRAAKTVTIRRGPRAGATMRVSGIARARYEFVFGRRADFREQEVSRLRAVLDRVLARASREAGSD
jgi:hypothetical protein